MPRHNLHKLSGIALLGGVVVVGCQKSSLTDSAIATNQLGSAEWTAADDFGLAVGNSGAGVRNSTVIVTRGTLSDDERALLEKLKPAVTVTAQRR